MRKILPLAVQKEMTVGGISSTVAAFMVWSASFRIEVPDDDRRTQRIHVIGGFLGHFPRT
jgi:hypothetical protein